MTDYTKIVEETYPAFDAWGMSTSHLSDVLTALQYLQVKIIATREISTEDAVLMLLIGADLLRGQDTDEIIEAAINQIRTVGHVADVIAMKKEQGETE